MNKRGATFKKQFASGLAAAGLLTLVCAAQAFAAPVAPSPLSVAVGIGYESEWNDEAGVQVCEVRYPGVYLMEGDAELYPELSEALDQANLMRANSKKDSKDNMVSRAEEKLPYVEPENWAPYQDVESVSVRRADTIALSLLYNDNSYSGGAHGYYGFWGETYNTQTGEPFLLSDVITDFALLKDAVRAQLDRFYPELVMNTETTLDEVIAQEKEQDLSWTLDNNGITLYFNPYVLASYAAGAQIVTISFAEYPELFYDYYKNTCDSYAVSLGNVNPFYLDLDKDGALDKLEIFGISNVYYAIENVRICLNGESRYQEETCVYSINPTLIHMKDGRDYLYMETLLDNDYRQIAVFDLTGGNVQKTDTYSAGMHAYVDADRMYPRQVLTMPDEFRLDKRSHILGSATATKHFHVGEDGMPVSGERWYELTFPQTITLKQELTVDVVDDVFGEKMDTKTLTPGTQVTVERTDTSSFADVRTEDGLLCRINVDASEWPQKIGGVVLEEVFDGVMFAG